MLENINLRKIPKEQRTYSLCLKAVEVNKMNLMEQFDFTGHVPVADIPKYTYIADGLIACLSKSELLDCTLPAKIFSYYAAGRPMVLAMNGEIQQIIADSKSGYIVDAEDYNGFADAICKLYLLKEEERVSMGKSAKEYYYNYFEHDINMSKLEQFISNESI